MSRLLQKLSYLSREKAKLKKDFLLTTQGLPINKEQVPNIAKKYLRLFLGLK
jgi:hypothetical protein